MIRLLTTGAAANTIGLGFSTLRQKYEIVPSGQTLLLGAFAMIEKSHYAILKLFVHFHN